MMILELWWTGEDARRSIGFALGASRNFGAGYQRY